MMKLNGKNSTGNVLVLNVLTSGGHIGENLYVLRLLGDTHDSRVTVLLHLIIMLSFVTLSEPYVWVGGVFCS